MDRPIIGFRVAGLVVLAVIIIVSLSRVGYGQNRTTIGQAVQCQPFQQIVAFDLLSGIVLSRGTIIVTPGTTITIDQVALRIDAIDSVAPVVAVVTTTVRSVTSDYYLPIPRDVSFVSPPRPLTLMQSGQLHADGGTNVTLSISLDFRYLSGNGRATWSVSGISCAA